VIGYAEAGRQRSPMASRLLQRRIAKFRYAKAADGQLHRPAEAFQHYVDRSLFTRSLLLRIAELPSSALEVVAAD